MCSNQRWTRRRQQVPPIHSKRCSVIGRLYSPSCWTDLDNPEDLSWYTGAAGNKSKPVDAAMIASWLHHTGPTPIW
jgi:hypothetical protein